MEQTLDPILIDLLKTQLRITTYEALALVAIIYGRSHPSTVADLAGIPRPKVYGALESLEKGELIVKSSEGDYEPNMHRISTLKDDSDKLLKKYNSFIEMLSSYSVGPNRILLHIRKDIFSLLSTMGYKVETEEQINKNLGRDDKEMIRRLSFRLSTSTILKHTRNSTDIKLRNELMHRRGLEKIRLPDFIVESPNSGIRVGTILHTQKKDITEDLPVICAAFDYLRCNAGIVITTPVYEPNDSDKEEGNKYLLHRFNIHLFFAKTDYLKEVQNFLNSLDLKWSQLKNTLTKLEELHNEAKNNSRGLINRLDNIFKNGDLYPQDYKPVFEDILSRIKNDLEANEQVLSQLDELISENFRLLNRKDLTLQFEDLSDVERRVNDTIGVLREKDKEIQNIEEELYSIPSDTNPYIRYGFKLNPFSLTVPLEKPNIIVNQQESRERAIEFINGVVRGSDSNLLLIIGEQGVGKSHFLNYFHNQIITSEFGKALAIKIRCKSNRDMVDLYPQITDDLKRLLKEKNETELIDVISKILTESGTPRLVQDLMKILKEIVLKLNSKGYQNLFILIDEFENSLPPVPEHRLPLDYDYNIRRMMAGRSMGTPQAISQLGSLTRLSGVGFIMTFRKNDWNMRQKEIKDRVSKIENKHIISLEPLSLQDSECFLIHRLEANDFRTPTTTFTESKFDNAAIELIWKKSNGNPRSILRLAGTAFRKSIRNSKSLIDISMIE